MPAPDPAKIPAPPKTLPPVSTTPPLQGVYPAYSIARRWFEPDSHVSLSSEVHTPRNGSIHNYALRMNPRKGIPRVYASFMLDGRYNWFEAYFGLANTPDGGYVTTAAKVIYHVAAEYKASKPALLNWDWRNPAFQISREHAPKRQIFDVDNVARLTIIAQVPHDFNEAYEDNDHCADGLVSDPRFSTDLPFS